MVDSSVTSFGIELGNAIFAGNFESNTPEWHALRMTGIGGSDVAGICKASPWSSPFKIWAVKTGRLDDSFVPSEAAEWGSRLEDVIIDKFQEKHPELIVHRKVGTWRNKTHNFQLANPDAIYETPDGRYGILEIKTSAYQDDWKNDDGEPGVPLWYRTQTQWYDDTFGFDMPIYVACLFSGRHYEEYVLAPSKMAQEAYRAEVEEFMSYIAKDEHPDFDGSMATYETVRELNPEIDSDGSVELGALGSAYIQATKAVDEAGEVLNEAKSRILDAMGTAKRGLLAGEWIVTRQSRNGGTPYLISKKGK